jgi:alkylation response protein AidB-like acyl-CoA dehydrogenase
MENQWLVLAESLGRDVLGKHAADVDRESRWPTESIAALQTSGLMGLTVAPALGGAGQGPGRFAGVVANLAGHCGSTAMIFLMHVCGTQMIADAKVFAWREEVLRDIAAGRHLTTVAFSEKGSRSHFWAPVSQAVADGPLHRISAEKSWVTSAGRANSYVLSTRSAAIAEPMALTLYYLPREATGLTVNGSWNGMGLRGNASAPMRLQDVAVPPSNRLSDEGKGFDAMMEVVLPWFQLGSAAVSVGIARAATEATRKHLLSARLDHLGQTLAALPNLRARLARMQIQVDVQSAFLAEAARQMEQPGPATLLTLLEVKAAAAEAALEVTDLAMRACGGAAFSRHLPVERHFRDARAAAVMAPTTDVLYDFIGRSMLGMPLF